MLLTEDDVICCSPPLFHCFGCILGYMATATHGSCIVFPTEAFSPMESLQAVHEYGCTALYGVPTMFLGELDIINSEPKPFPPNAFKTLRTGIAAGSQIPSNLMRRLHKELNLTELTICYGMTETAPVSAMTTTDDPIQKRVETVGRLLPHVTAKVVDKSNPDRICDVGEQGELVVSGYLVMKGYWGDEAKTSEVRKTEKYVDEEGREQERVWMYTGDEAIMDEEGYVRITGRLKDIIIRGGENIHPLDVENVLLAHPDVGEVSAYGLPDERYGEVVSVSVIRKPGTTLSDDDIRTFVREKLANHFGRLCLMDSLMLSIIDRLLTEIVPKHIFWTDALPKTPSGKIQRFKLRKDAIQTLRLDER